MERPERLTELDWPLERARAFAEQALDLLVGLSAEMRRKYA